MIRLVIIRESPQVNLNKIDLNLFVAFEAIYSEDNLSQAAERLSLSQPAVSNILNRLRETTGDPLFVRSGRGMIATPAAHELINPVRQALKLLENSLQQINEFDPSTSEKSFRIGSHLYPDTLLLPILARRLQEVAPNIDVELFYLKREEAEKQLMIGKIDFYIDSPKINSHSLNNQRIYSDHYVCLLREEHPLASKPLSMEDYLNLSHVLLTLSEESLGLLDTCLAKIGKQRRIVLRTRQHEAIAQTIRESNYSSTMPARMSKHPGLVQKELPFEVPRIDVRLYWNRNSDSDKASQWFRDMIMWDTRKAKDISLVS